MHLPPGVLVSSLDYVLDLATDGDPDAALRAIHDAADLGADAETVREVAALLRQPERVDGWRWRLTLH